MIRLAGTWLVEGPIRGRVVRLDEPVSFWGGFDAATGCIIDRAHPQRGENLGGKVVATPGSRGSAGTPGVLGEAIRRGTGPAALIVTRPDINLIAGALTAEALYGTRCPVLLVTPEQFELLVDGVEVAARPSTHDPGGLYVCSS